MEEFQVVLLELKVLFSGVDAGDQLGRCGPEDIVVVGEEGEEDAEEETGWSDDEEGCEWGGAFGWHFEGCCGVWSVLCLWCCVRDDGDAGK